MYLILQEILFKELLANRLLIENDLEINEFAEKPLVAALIIYISIKEENLFLIATCKKMQKMTF